MLYPGITLQKCTPAEEVNNDNVQILRDDGQMGTLTTNALPWSHFPTFGLIYFVFAQHCHGASYFALFVRNIVPPNAAYYTYAVEQCPVYHSWVVQPENKP